LKNLLAQQTPSLSTDFHHLHKPSRAANHETSFDIHLPPHSPDPTSKSQHHGWLGRRSEWYVAFIVLTSKIKLTLFTAAAADGGFMADNSVSNDAWAPQSTAGDDDDTGYIGENVSKHAGGDGDGCRKYVTIPRLS
jgi:hypothetical protein